MIRLFALAVTDRTLLHRLTECNEVTEIWSWTRLRTAIILRMDPRHVPPDWTIRPSFLFWPPQRHAALLWILANMVYYIIQHRKKLSLADYADFMRRARWKAYHTERRLAKFGNYLETI
jgi:hypothetical protein